MPALLPVRTGTALSFSFLLSLASTFALLASTFALLAFATLRHDFFLRLALGRGI